MENQNKYEYLEEAVHINIFKRIKNEFPEMLEQWNEECRLYNYVLTDEEIGECGENLTRFQVATFGSEPIEDYLDDLRIQ